MAEIKERELTEEFKKSFMVNLKGKDFVTFDGLMVLAHADGMKGVKTVIAQIPSKENDDTAVIHAIVTDANGNEWHGTGDASPASVGKTIANAVLRMAETRAIGRALRMMLGIGTMMEEVYNPFEPPVITDVQVKQIRDIMKKRGISKELASEVCSDTFGKKAAGHLTKDEAASFIELLRKVEVPEDEDDGDDADE